MHNKVVDLKYIIFLKIYKSREMRWLGGKVRENKLKRVCSPAWENLKKDI
jgi:hypothetical protein